MSGNSKINWPAITREIRDAGMTLRDIANEAGFPSLSTVSDLSNGKCDEDYEPKHSQGDALIRIHRRITKRAAKQSANKKAVKQACASGL